MIVPLGYVTTFPAARNASTCERASGVRIIWRRSSPIVSTRAPQVGLHAYYTAGILRKAVPAWQATYSERHVGLSCGDCAWSCRRPDLPSLTAGAHAFRKMPRRAWQ